jgi:hypothetical protein
MGLQKRLKKSCGWAAILCASAAMTACEQQGADPTTLGTGGGGGTSTLPTTINEADFQADIVPADGVTASLHKNGSFSTACKVTAAQVGTSAAAIDCVLEQKELDMYIGGYEIAYNVPSNMCKYVRVMPYYYYTYKPGFGATTVNVTTTNGTLSAFTYTGGSTGTVIGYNNGALTCNWDHSQGGGVIKGPNCCDGSYTLNTRVITTGASPTDVTTTSTLDWPGHASNCLSGPAMDTQAKDVYGYPKSSVYSLFGKQLKGSYVVKPPVERFYTNLHGASYFLSGNYDNAATWPEAISGPGGGIPQGSPFFTLDCYDEAADLAARIRVLTRAWTTKSAYDAQDPTLADTAGSEPSPFGSYPYNDFYSWKILTTAFGNSYYPTTGN